MIYSHAINFGENFITSKDKTTGYIEGFPGDVWVCDNHMGYWVAKVNGDRKTKAEAQTLVDVPVAAHQAEWDAKSEEEQAGDTGPDKARPPNIVLP